MQVFLDTNILLSYLKGRKVNSVLPKILDLAINKKIILITTSQIKDEYLRNFVSAKSERIKEIENTDEDISVNFTKYKNLESFNKEVKKSLEKINTKINKRRDGILKEKKDFKERELNIKIFFNTAINFNEDDEILKKAQLRYLKGNPPRKNKEKNESFGDAINWELILRGVDKKDELIVISGDGDYSEILYEKINLNSLLIFEWKKKSKKRITLFNSLGEFINKFKDEEIVNKKLVNEEKENIKDELVFQRDMLNDDNIVDRKIALGYLKDYVKNVVSQLSPMEQKIIEMRFGLIDGVSHTLEEVGQEFEMTRERIHKIEAKSLEKIRNFKGLERLKMY